MEVHQPIQQAFSPDERYLAYVGPDYTIILWDLLAGKEVATLRGHTWIVEGLVFSADSRLLASGDWDGTCRIWDVDQLGPAKPHILRGHRSGVYRIAFASDGRTIATTSDDNTHKLWSLKTGQELLSLPFIKNEEVPDSYPLFSPDGNHLLRVVQQRPEVVIELTQLPSIAEIDETSLAPGTDR